MTIVVDPRLDAVRGGDVRQRDATLDVREPDASELTDAFAVSRPLSFLTGNRTWDDAYLDALESGDWVATVGAGYDRFPLDEFDRRVVAFTNAPGINAPQVAEHVFATALSFTRRLRVLRDLQDAGELRYQRRDALSDLVGDRCCVVGLGHVGEAVAERANGFGMTVAGVKRTVEGYTGAADVVHAPDALYDALADARLVVLSVPLTEDTRGMVGGDELAVTASDAIVVNVSRGPVLDTEALLAALEGGEIAAACLDVTDPEPLPASSPLWDRDDVLITPHCAGLSEKYAARFLDEYLPQYDRWRRGGTLENRVV